MSGAPSPGSNSRTSVALDVLNPRREDSTYSGKWGTMISIYLHVHLPIYLSTNIDRSINRSIYIYPSASIYVYVSISIYRSIRICLCKSSYLAIKQINRYIHMNT